MIRIEVEEEIEEEMMRKKPYIEKVVSVRRVSKVVKGGRNLSFAAFVVIGDEKGKVGFSSGKLQLVPDAVRKAVTTAKKN